MRFMFRAAISAALIIASMAIVGSASASASLHEGMYLFHGENDWKEPGQFASEIYPVTIAGQGAPGQGYPVLFRTYNFKYGCPQVSLSSPFARSSSELSLSATYEGCVATFAEPATINMNGCQWHLNITSLGLPPYTGTVAIACPPGEYVSMRENLKAYGECWAHFPPQSGSVSYENSVASWWEREKEALPDIVANVSLSGLEYTQGGALCGGETVTKHDGTLVSRSSLVATYP